VPEARRYRPKSRAEIARNMSAIHSTDTATEMALRHAIHRLGIRYRLYSKALTGRPDLVFPSARLIVFVDGDFWHGRILKERGVAGLRASMRTKNRAYWLKKMTRNVARDVTVTKSLRAGGWKVMRLWETDVRRNVESIASRIERAVRRAREVRRRRGK